MSLKTPPQPLAYTLDEIPQAGRIGKSKIKEEIAAGELPIVKIGKRTLVLHEDLHAYLVRHRVTRGNGNGSSIPPPPELPLPPAAPPRRRRQSRKSD
jgi:excisionase family DNA binding protein